jgi:hypothetical protein
MNTTKSGTTMWVHLERRYSERMAMTTFLGHNIAKRFLVSAVTTSFSLALAMTQSMAAAATI